MRSMLPLIAMPSWPKGRKSLAMSGAKVRIIYLPTSLRQADPIPMGRSLSGFVGSLWRAINQLEDKKGWTSGGRLALRVCWVMAAKSERYGRYSGLFLSGW